MHRDLGSLCSWSGPLGSEDVILVNSYGEPTSTSWHEVSPVEQPRGNLSFLLEDKKFSFSMEMARACPLQSPFSLDKHP